MSKENTEVKIIHIGQEEGSENMLRSVGDRGESQQIDPFEKLYSQNEVLRPPYDPCALSKTVEECDSLSSCVNAMKTNITGFGYDLVSVRKFEEGSAEFEEAMREHARIQQFFKFINPEMPFSELRARTRQDLETTGNAFWEIIENGKGEIVGIEHMPAHTMRLTPLDKEVVDGISFIQGENGEWEEIVYPRRFRKFVQIADGCSQKRYFKDFGDPRVLDVMTGKFSREGAADSPAHSVIHFKLYSVKSPYGVPRWLGASFQALGRQKSSKVNYLYFDNKAVPPLAVLVSGGALTGESITRLKEHFQKLKGEDNYHAVPILEAVPVGSDNFADPVARSSVRIEIKNLSEAIEKDGLFMNYMEAAFKDVRVTFRIPPIFVGRTEDFNRATAETSRFVAEEQVFQPERNLDDFIINQKIFPFMGFKFWTFKTKGAVEEDAEVIEKILRVAHDTGSITPNEARTVVARILGVEMAPFDLEQANTPIQLANVTPADLTTIQESLSKNSNPIDAVRAVKEILRIKHSLENEL